MSSNVAVSFGPSAKVSRTQEQPVIGLRTPVIALVLAATIIPVELRSLSRAHWDFSGGVYDVAENIAAFVVLGIVLGMGFLKTVIAGALISSLAEASQFFMAHRDPSVIDVISNTIGTILGALISTHWRLRSPELRIEKWIATLAVAMAVVLFFGIRSLSGGPLNDRGATSPGTLEGYWKFDEGSGRFAFDSSGHELQGSFRHQARRTVGVRGGGVAVEGSKGYIDLGHSSAFRLAGSMTISTWINSSSFLEHDAPIVSQFQGETGYQRGYQLDTTMDQRLRVIGFKLTNSCGDLMARYGATPLLPGIWYYVAGVYDATARTMDVYLNGELDNGPLLGKITARQRSSRLPLYIGRRSDSKGFQFAGSIDEVRVYSFALNKAQIIADMHGQIVPATQGSMPGRSQNSERHCGLLSDYEDSKIPAAAATLGVLVAIACVGLWARAGAVGCLVTSIAAGLLLLPLMPSSLPLLSRWTMPLVSLAGGVSIAVSLRSGAPLIQQKYPSE
jgi:Concanavalin A-like lectin/glucanases superfamily/VanZ like family